MRGKDMQSVRRKGCLCVDARPWSVRKKGFPLFVWRKEKQLVRRKVRRPVE